MLDVTHHQENANQDHHELPLTSTRMAIIRKDKVAGVGEDVQRVNPWAAVVGMQNGAGCGKWYSSPSKN